MTSQTPVAAGTRHLQPPDPQLESARRFAVAFEQRLEAVRQMHRKFRPGHRLEGACAGCGNLWPCETARLIDAPYEAGE